MNISILTGIRVKPLLYLLTILLTVIGFSNALAIGENYDETGFRSNKTYIRYSPQEYINPFSGNLILSHTDIVLPGNGGLDLKIQRTYNSKIFNDPDTGEIAGITWGSMGVGWDLHFGRINTYAEPFFLQMPNGSLHTLYNNNHPNINSHITSDYVTEDFWIVRYDGANDQYTMTLPDGTVYTFGQHLTNFTSYNYYYVTSIKDKNGNEIRIEYFDCCNMDGQDPNSGNLGTCPSSDFFSRTRHIKRIVDSVGRVIDFGMLNNSCRGNAVSSIDVNGKTYNYLYFPGPDGPSSPVVNYDGGSTRLLKEVKPPEGPSWKYFYDADGVSPDGELISVTYPSGGAVEYQYGTFNLTLKGAGSKTQTFRFRGITSRTASGPDITPGTWTYSYDTSSTQDSTTVTDPCGNREVYRFSGLRQDSFNGVWGIGLVQEKQIRDPNNNVFQTETNSWSPYQISTDGRDPISDIVGTFVPLLNSRTISRDGNIYTTDFIYNTFYGAPTKIEESGELVRTTDISYFESLSNGDYIVGKPLVITVNNGTETKTITNSYDSKGNLLSENRYGVITEFSYYPDGNLEWEKNARGFYTHFDQYDFGVAGRIRYGSSSALASDPVYTETKTINWEGTIASSTNGRGYKTLFSYDGLNRLTQVTPPLSGEAGTLITYDNTSGRSYIIKKGISEVKYDFDGLGRPIGTQLNTGVKTETRYDGCGRKIYESLPFDGSTPNTGDGFNYDALGRITSITHADNTSVTYSYSGNTVTIRNERNLNTTLIFNSFGDPDDKRLISVKDTNNNTTSYEYDLLGNITRVDSPAGGDRVFTYNSKNLLVSETHPESGTTTYTHDAVGNVISKTDANNQTIHYQYDALNRLILVDHPSGEDDITYAYDNANNRTLMQSNSGSYSYSYEYDQSNRLTRENVILGNMSYIVDFVYDERNNLVQAIYPSGEVVNYNYDAGNRLSDIFDASNVLFIGNIAYHPSGAPTHYVNANSVSSDFTYDNRHRLRTVKISRPFPELKVIKEGLGSGTVTSDPLGIDCGNDCRQVYPAENIEVTLIATPDSGSNFGSWSGDPDCLDGIVTMDGNKTCIATFASGLQEFTLTVNKSGAGGGTVTSNPFGIDCGSDCTENYGANTQVTLTSTPDADSNFTGWSGDPDCSDGVVTMDANKTCTATFTIPTQGFTLTVSKNGFGSGTVTSTPAGIDCGSDCTENYDQNTSVTLTTTPAVGSRFIGWTGDSDCTDGTVTMDADKTCTAAFERVFTLTIQKNGTGSGRIKSAFENPPRIDCGNDCTEDYIENTPVAFEIIPDPGSTFSGWSGTPGCPTSASEGVLMTSNLTCRATFDLLPGKTLTINKQGDGFGTVTSNPTGINCGSDCSGTYNQDTEVTLTPVPNSGSIFGGWSGAPDCSDGALTMDTDKTCTATFTQSTNRFSLDVGVSGFGIVNATGIRCIGAPANVFNNDCSETYTVNTKVTLIPTPTGPLFNTNPPIDYNSTFIGWSGDPDCLDGKITMDADKTCKAIFTPYKLDVIIFGSGTVTISPPGNTCTTYPNCSKYYRLNTGVTLTPIPSSGSIFMGWSGDPDCSDSMVTMDAEKTCRATFVIKPTQQFTLTVSKNGTGGGTITSNPAGINCGSDCTENYNENTQVTLTPIPDVGSSFSGWSGDPDCSDGVITLNANKTCTATFNKNSNCDCNHPNAIRGTNGNDTLTGTAGADIICGLGGDDTLKGLGGADCIDGGGGNDKIYGGGGNDKLYGGKGRDTLQGSGGSDLLDGGPGVDTLDGGNNSDTCINGETVTNCEGLSSLVDGISPITGGTTFAGQNPKNRSISSLLSSYAKSLRLSLLSLLFATNAFAQAMIPPTTFIDLEYSYDGVGNVTGIVDHVDQSNNRSMQYDNLDRLTGASGPWGPGSFNYDSIGNRTGKSIAGGNKNYSYGPLDNHLGGYSHDNNGNLLQDDNFTYEYDSENRLIRVLSGSNVVAEYKYDGDGRRISKTVDGVTTFYAYGIGLNVLTEFNGQGVPRFDYIYAGNRNIARVNFDSNGAPNNKTFYHTDHLGSNIAITDATSTVIWDQTYLPFGDFHSGSGLISNSRQYTGKEFEEETGLYYYGARYYHPGFGRFMSVDPAPGDPIDPQSWNRYSYTLNNPYKYIDPDGEAALIYKANLQPTINLNNSIRSKLDFMPDFILDAFFPVDPESVASAFLLGPQVLEVFETGVISKGAGRAIKLINIVEKSNILPKPDKVPYAGGFIRSFVTEKDEIYYRVFSGNRRTGSFLTKVRPKNKQQAIEGLSLPPWNSAEFIQEVLVPTGTRLQRSRALPVPEFGRYRGGLEQFELLDRIPDKNFGPGVPFE